MNRNPENLFAETEQVASARRHRSGLDFSHESVRAGRSIRTWNENCARRTNSTRSDMLRCAAHTSARGHRQSSRAVAYEPIRSPAGVVQGERRGHVFRSHTEDKVRQPEKLADHDTRRRSSGKTDADEKANRRGFRFGSQRCRYRGERAVVR